MDIPVQSQPRPCSTCKFHIHIQGGAHLQHCTKYSATPQPCAAVRPKCDGKDWEAQ